MKVTKKKTLVVIISLVILACSLIMFLANRSNNARYFSCYFKNGSSTARCLPKVEDQGGCYGFYDARGKNVKDGIDPMPHLGATCEGFFSGTDTVYFNKNGKYVH